MQCNMRRYIFLSLTVLLCVQDMRNTRQVETEEDEEEEDKEEDEDNEEHPPQRITQVCTYSYFSITPWLSSRWSTREPEKLWSQVLQLHKLLYETFLPKYYIYHGTQGKATVEQSPPPMASGFLPNPGPAPTGYYWAWMPFGSPPVNQWVAMPITPQQQLQQPQPQVQLQQLGQGGQTVSAIPSAPIVTGGRPVLNVVLTNVLMS